jgi:hypothetical protein
VRKDGKTIRVLHPYSYFGERSLLCAEPASAEVRELSLGGNQGCWEAFCGAGLRLRQYRPKPAAHCFSPGGNNQRECVTAMGKELPARVLDSAVKKLRIVTLGISGGRWLTGPLRDARRFPSTRRYLDPGTTRTTLGFGICLSFKDHSLSPCAKP